MASSEEVFVTSRSRTPSFINVTSQKDHIFAQLPDLIQEALVSAEFSSPQIEITRVHHSQTVNHAALTEPVFFIRSRVDSGISMVDFHVTDEEILGKFGTDLTANFADIRVYGPKAFFQKENPSNGVTYSLSACATGYIWIYVTPKPTVPDYSGFLDVEVQIGTFASRTRAVTTSEISCRYLPLGSDLLAGHLAVLCSAVLGIYLRLRMMGHQYEYATETAIKQGRKDLCELRVVEPGWFGINGELFNLLRGICANAPMPPISDVSLISRSMITRRWDCLRETRTLRKTHFFPLRALRSLKGSNKDALHLLTRSFKALEQKRKNLSSPAADYPKNGTSLQSFYNTIPCQTSQMSSSTGPSRSDLSRS